MRFTNLAALAFAAETLIEDAALAAPRKPSESAPEPATTSCTIPRRDRASD
jgi:hypothetical protein